MKKLLFVLLLVAASQTVCAAQGKRVVVVNYMGDDGLLYSFNKMQKQEWRVVPTIKRMQPRDWGLRAVLTDGFAREIGSISGGYTVVPLDEGLYKALELARLTQVVNENELPRAAIEKLAKLGREQKVDIVFAVFPTKGRFQPPGAQSAWVATPPGMAFIYAGDKIWTTVAVRSFVIDVQSRKVRAASHPMQKMEQAELPPRVLTRDEAAKVVKWVNEDIPNPAARLQGSDVDFNKPLGKKEIEKIISKVPEKNQEHLHLLDLLLYPLHHTIDDFEKQPVPVMSAFRASLHKAARADIADNVGYVFSIAYEEPSEE